MDKQLEFFKKDEIEWGDYKYADFYKTLFDLKHRNEALWNGTHGGDLIKIPTGKDEAVYAFTREKNGDKVVVMINLSAQKQDIEVGGETAAGEYLNVFSGEKQMLKTADKMTLQPWEYVVLESGE